MGNHFNLKVNSDTLVYYYSDKQSREEKKPTDVFTNVNEQKMSLPEQYKSLFERLKGLDGDAKTLSSEDISLGRDVIHEYGINEVRIDPKNRVSTFGFKDGTAISIDMKMDNNDEAMRKLALIQANGYNKYYDIKLSDDGQFFEIEVKETDWYMPDPKAITIIKDFGLTDNSILYDNNAENYPKYEHTRRTDWDGNVYETTFVNAIFPAGQKFKLPVSAVTVQSDLHDFAGRLMDRASHWGNVYKEWEDNYSDTF